MLEQYRGLCSEDWGEISCMSAVKYGVKWETVKGEERGGFSDSKTEFVQSEGKNYFGEWKMGKKFKKKKKRRGNTGCFHKN